jgi:4-amino-4-deoxy-L-arabinose transferase-like glycosyltransferase
MTPEVLQESSVTPAKKISWLRQVFPAMLVALAIRMVVVYFYYRQLPDADQSYEQFGWEVGWVARALASGHGFSSPVYPITGPTAMVPPLYTCLLAAIFKLFGIYTLTSGFIILTLNSLFSSLNCVAVYFSAAYSLGQRAARIAAWVWALYPFAIYFSADRVWEYSLTSLLLTTCFCIAQRLHRWEKWTAWLGFGALYGVTAHSNPSVLSLFPFLLLLAAWKVRKAGGRWLANSAVAVLALTAVMTPWTVRNYRVLHVLCPVRDDYWINIYAGNYNNTSPNNRPSNPSAHPPSNPEEMRKFLTMGEIPYLKEKHVLAAEWIRQHPLGYGRAVLRRAVYYWTGYWSLQREYLDIEPTEVPMMFYICCVTLLALRGVRRFWKWNRAAGMPYFMLVGIFPISYYLSLVLVDYRQPIEPAIVVLAIAGALPFRRANAENWIGAERAIESLTK